MDIIAVPSSLSPLFENPRLYLLVRNDLESMNPGKAVAQGGHAATGFMWALLGATYDDQKIRRPDVQDAFNEWVHQADLARGHMIEEQGFGTSITLQAKPDQMREAVRYARLIGMPAAVIHDPTYPLRDGSTTHFIPLDTTAYVFAGKIAGEMLLSHLGLM